MFHVEAIGYDRIEELLDIMREKARWLNSTNRAMWDVSKLTKEALIERYDFPKPFLGLEDKTPVGGFLLLDYDKNYWRESRADAAFYVHKFVVRNGYGGRSYSQRMLEWIKDYGKEQGKQFVRLDYSKERSYLRSMYLRHGFKDIEELKMKGGEVMIKGEYKVFE
jgi:hypothetical protein